MAEAQASGRARAAVLVAAVLLLGVRLGAVDAWAPDEPRYLQVAEELRSMQHGPDGLVLLHLDGEPYTQKPPLYFWMAALFGAPAGRVGETAGRLPSALAGIALIAATLALGGRMLGGRVGLIGAALLLTVFEFGHLARRVQLDVVLALFETTALFLFWRIDRGLGRRWPQVLALHVSLGLGVLTKGPVGFLVPVLVMTAFLLWERRPRALLRVLPAWALPVSLLPGIVWIVGATALAPGGFAGEAIGENLIGRFFAGTSHARPPWYFLYQLPLDFLPWTVLWPAVALVGRRAVFGNPEVAEEDRRAWRFLLAWVGASLAFFSLSAGKRGLYLLPAFPALALLCADALARALAGHTRLPRAIGWPLAALSMLLAGAGVLVLLASVAGAHHDATAEILAWVETGWLLAFGLGTLGTLLAGGAAWIGSGRMRTSALRRIAIVVAGAWALEVAIFQLLYPALDPGRSPRPIAEAVARVTSPEERVGLVSDRAMRGGIVYYGGRSVAELGDEESIRSFFAQGGRAVVAKARKLDRVEAIRPMRVVEQLRAGRRAVVVAVPRGGEGDGAVRRRTAP